ncbi:MAG: nitroreductase family protein [Microbacteriaceae bacterium]|nr:nitroreductase family protein [Microbacteriaceae bacterium]MCI1206880.1 nitroreductase family protein [Microbacteriaceae bacterium]
MCTESAALSNRYPEGFRPEALTGAAPGPLLAHRSRRRFSDRPVTEADLTSLFVTAQSAPTSSNLQLWTVIHATDPALRTRLRALCGGQQMLTAAPVLLVWVADPSRDAVIARQHGGTGATAGLLETTLTAVVDVTIAAQTLFAAAELHGMAGCYIGGARNHPEELATELSLPRGAFAVFAMALGWPDSGDTAAVRPRLPLRSVVHSNTYRPIQPEEVAAFDAATTGYYRTHGRADHQSWIRQITDRLTDPATMHGREQLVQELRDLGVGLG